MRNVQLDVPANMVTALIGPSGCGKSTLLRTLNRMHELVPGARVDGAVLLDGQDLYAPGINPIRVRRQIGMVFQKPTPFPTMSIRENVAAGLKVGRMRRDEEDHIVEGALRHAALWDEVKDRLNQAATSLSGGQQAAALHRADPRAAARGRPARRAHGLARSDRHRAHRGAGPRAQAGIHRRHRDAQHAAGRAGVGLDGLLLSR